MKIIIDKNYGVTLPQGNLLGYLQENKLRKLEIIHPKFDKVKYAMMFEYSDGVIYEQFVENGVLAVGGSLLRTTGNVKCQFKAFDDSADTTEELIFLSEIFILEIKDSIDGNADKIPTYEQTYDLLGQLMNAINILSDAELDLSGFATKNQLDERFGGSNIKIVSREDFRNIPSKGDKTIYFVKEKDGTISHYLKDVRINGDAKTGGTAMHILVGSKGAISGIIPENQGE